MFSIGGRRKSEQVLIVGLSLDDNIGLTRSLIEIFRREMDGLCVVGEKICVPSFEKAVNYIGEKMYK